MICKISTSLDRKGHATMFTEHLIIILKIIKYGFFFCVSKWRIRDRPLSVRLFFLFFFSFSLALSLWRVSLACLRAILVIKRNMLENGHWIARDIKSFVFSRSVAVLLFIPAWNALAVVIFLVRLWKRNYIVSVVMRFPAYNLNYLWEVTARKI